MGNPDEWLEKVRECEYLPEQDIKKLCEMVTRYCVYKVILLIINIGERNIIRGIKHTTSAFTCYCLWRHSWYIYI